jgi:hypothetical protein
LAIAGVAPNPKSQEYVAPGDAVPVKPIAAVSFTHALTGIENEADGTAYIATDADALAVHTPVLTDKSTV